MLDVNFSHLAVQPAMLFSQKGVGQRLIAPSETTNPGGGYFFTTTTFRLFLHSVRNARSQYTC